MGTISYLDMDFKMKTAAFDSGMDHVRSRLKGFGKDAEEAGKSSESMWSNPQRMLKHIGHLYGIHIALEGLKVGTEEYIKLQEKVAKGEITKGEAINQSVMKAVESIPLIGAAISSISNISDIVSGKAEAEARKKALEGQKREAEPAIKAGTEATNKLLLEQATIYEHLRLQVAKVHGQRAEMDEAASQAFAKRTKEIDAEQHKIVDAYYKKKDITDKMPKGLERDSQEIDDVREYHKG